MGSAAHRVCVLLCFCGLVIGDALRTVGPCSVNTGKASFNCSGRNLAEIPQEIWANVTTLNLSQNRLDLTHTGALKPLEGLDHLVTLNLSGNYLPLLARGRLCSLPSLEVLDLSGCQLAAVEPGALQALPRLQMLFLGNNRLQGPLSDDLGTIRFLDLRGNQHVGASSAHWPKGAERTLRFRSPKAMTQEGDFKGLGQNFIHRQFHRRLLAETIEITTPNATNDTGSTEGSVSPSHSWPYLVAVLATAVSISILIAVAAKCKIVHRYLASYRHSRLTDGDSASQCDPASFEVGFSAQGGAPGRVSHSAAPADDTEEDDDGFIEDNYIQASERERAARAAAEMDNEDEDDEEFTIG